MYSPVSTYVDIKAPVGYRYQHTRQQGGFYPEGRAHAKEFKPICICLLQIDLKHYMASRCFILEASYKDHLERERYLLKIITP